MLQLEQTQDLTILDESESLDQFEKLFASSDWSVDAFGTLFCADSKTLQAVRNVVRIDGRQSETDHRSDRQRAFRNMRKGAVALIGGAHVLWSPPQLPNFIDTARAEVSSELAESVVGSLYGEDIETCAVSLEEDRVVRRLLREAPGAFRLLRMRWEEAAASIDATGKFVPPEDGMLKPAEALSLFCTAIRVAALDEIEPPSSVSGTPEELFWSGGRGLVDESLWALMGAIDTYSAELRVLLAEAERNLLAKGSTDVLRASSLGGGTSGGVDYTQCSSAWSEALVSAFRVFSDIWDRYQRAKEKEEEEEEKQDDDQQEEETQDQQGSPPPQEGGSGETEGENEDEGEDDDGSEDAGAHDVSTTEAVMDSFDKGIQRLSFEINKLVRDQEIQQIVCPASLNDIPAEQIEGILGHSNCPTLFAAEGGNLRDSPFCSPFCGTVFEPIVTDYASRLRNVMEGLFVQNRRRQRRGNLRIGSMIDQRSLGRFSMDLTTRVFSSATGEPQQTDLKVFILLDGSGSMATPVGTPGYSRRSKSSYSFQGYPETSRAVSDGVTTRGMVALIWAQIFSEALTPLGIDVAISLFSGGGNLDGRTGPDESKWVDLLRDPSLWVTEYARSFAASPLTALGGASATALLRGWGGEYATTPRLWPSIASLVDYDLLKQHGFETDSRLPPIGGGGTPEGEALWSSVFGYIAPRLRPEEAALILVVNDGEPTSGVRPEFALAPSGECVTLKPSPFLVASRWCEANNVGVFALGICDSGVDKYYAQCVSMREADFEVGYQSLEDGIVQFVQAWQDDSSLPVVSDNLSVY